MVREGKAADITDLELLRYYYYGGAGNQPQAATFAPTSPAERDSQDKGLHGRSPRKIAVAYNT